MNRRALLRAGAAAAALVAAGFRPVSAQERAQTPAQLIEAAQALASAPFQPWSTDLPPPFDALSYDSHRGIRPVPGLSADLPLGAGFTADLLPPGWLFRDPVELSLPGIGTESFDPARFSFDPRYFPQGAPEAVPGLEHAGLRLRYPLNHADRPDDLLVLQGASYFRALAHGTAYGLSARALALGTGGTGPEEFPVTRRIVVFGTEPGVLHLGCLIDSPRAAAALIVALHPGRAAAPATIMDCTLHLFARVPLTDAGIAPLTSMFQHNALGPAAVDDFRPAVHDSDVLLIDNGAGERLWRPLSNPARVQLSAFVDSAPRRFGLLQTPDNFTRFRDGEGAYHRRPSAMVEPLGDWGAGAVMLLEIPTRDEYADNIVAFWRPAAPLLPGQAHRFEYRLSWLPPGPGGAAAPSATPAMLPLSSASGIEPARREGRLFVIDYAPAPGTDPAAVPDTASLTLDLAPVQGARIEGAALYPLPESGEIRASFTLVPEAGAQGAELRLRLRRADTGALVAPVWMYRWTPARDGGP